MSSIKAAEQAMETALAERKIGPGVVMVASDTTGKFQYVKELGHRSVADPKSPPFDKHTVMRLASCTKLMASVAALQCVERGLLTLDGPIGDVVPRLRERQVISLNFDDELVYTPASKPITLRHMLNHTSGMSYDFFSPAMRAWVASTGVNREDRRRMVPEHDYPQIFESGTSWQYGVGLDWAGAAVQAVTGLDLHDYMREHMWKPLGITHMTFWPQKDPEIVALMPDLGQRDADTGLINAATTDRFKRPADDPLGGGGALAPPDEYLRILESLLRDDGKLLKPETAKLLFEPSLEPSAKMDLQDLNRASPDIRRAIARQIENIDSMDYSLGGLLSTQAVPGFRGKNAVMWAGLPNLIWFIDRERGLCGMAAAQMLPSADELLTDLLHGWERAIYQHYDEWKAGNH